METHQNLRLIWQSGDATAWCASLRPASRSQIASLWQILSSDEQEQATRYGSLLLQERFILRRALLRTLLGTQLACSPTDLRFCREQFGKPILAQGGPHFSVSSSGDLALIALSPTAPLGADLEKIDPNLPLEDTLLHQHFTAAERRLLDTTPPGPERIALFYRGWTGKEACAKATGYGLSHPLTAYEVLRPDLRTDNETLSLTYLNPSEEGTPENTTLRTAPYCAAIALCSPAKTIRGGIHETKTA